MIIQCEFNIRPESAKRIETDLCSISEDEGVLSFNFKEKEREKMIRYYRKLISGLLIMGGGFLLLEHLFAFEGFDIELLVGHEVYGLLMIGAGFLISLKWEQLPSFIKAIKNRDWKGILDKGERRG